MPEPLTEQQAREVAQLFLTVSSLPEGGSIPTMGKSYPVLAAGAQNVGFYEIALTFPDTGANGYILVRATRDRRPIVEYCDNKPPRSERLAQRAGTQQLRLVRYGVGYTVAENQDGKLLAELGTRPFSHPAAPPPPLRGEVQRDGTGRQTETLTGSHSTALSLPEQPATYEAFRQSYLQRHTLLRAQTQTAAATDPEVDQYWRLIATAMHLTVDQLKKLVTVEYFEIPGAAERPFYQQIDPRTPPNSNDHSTGCGPTAWMNLYGWHDLMWTRNLLPGESRSDTSTTHLLTVAVHDWLGTERFPGTSEGLTWPDDMARGFFFPLQYLGHDCGYAGCWDNDTFFVDTDKVFRVIRNAIVRDRRPCIVGHDTGFVSRHYGIGYAVRDAIFNGSRMWQQVRIYPCWGDDDSDYYVSEGDTFAAYYVTQFVQRPWEVKVRTGSRDSAGTDANVYLKAFGNGGWCPEVKLDKRDWNDFESGKTDTFLVSLAPPVGGLPSVENISIRHDNSGHRPGWFLDWVQLRHMMSGRVWRFYCNRWLAKDEDDHRIERELANPEVLTAYKIRVVTANEANAGTDANVYVRLTTPTQQRSAEAYLNRASVDDFERGSVCVFTVPLTDLGAAMASIDVRHDYEGNKPGWKIAYIDVFDPIRRLQWHAECNRWLNIGSGFRATFALTPQTTLIGISDW